MLHNLSLWRLLRFSKNRRWDKQQEQGKNGWWIYFERHA